MADDQLDDFWDFLEEEGFYSPPVPGSVKILDDAGKVVRVERTAPREFFIPSPDAETGARFAALSSISAKQAAHLKGAHVEVTENEVARIRLDGADEREFYAQVLGSAYTEMIEAGVAWITITRLGQFAFIYWTQGRAVAEKAAREGVLSGGKARAAETLPTTPTTTSRGSRKPTGSTRTSRTTPKKR